MKIIARILYLIVILVISGCHIESINKEKKKGLYAMALSAYITKADSTYRELGWFANREILVEVDRDNLEIPYQYMPVSIKDYKIRYLERSELVKLVRRNEEIPIIKIRAIESEDDSIIIRFGEYKFSHKEDSFFYGLSQGCVVSFAFDRKNQTYFIEKVKLWGV